MGLFDRKRDVGTVQIRLFPPDRHDIVIRMSPDVGDFHGPAAAVAFYLFYAAKVLYALGSKGQALRQMLTNDAKALRMGVLPERCLPFDVDRDVTCRGRLRTDGQTVAMTTSFPFFPMSQVNYMVKISVLVFRDHVADAQGSAERLRGFGIAWMAMEDYWNSHSGPESAASISAAPMAGFAAYGAQFTDGR